MNSYPRSRGLLARGVVVVAATLSTSLVLTSTPGAAAIQPSTSDTSMRAAASDLSNGRALARKATTTKKAFVTTTTHVIDTNAVIVGNTGTWTSTIDISDPADLRCKYKMRAGLSFETPIQNREVVRNFMDYLDHRYSNAVTSVDVVDLDKDQGGNVRVRTKGSYSYRIPYPVACKPALASVMDQPANSRGRQVAANTTQTLVLIAVWGTLAYAAARSGHPALLGNQYFEAGAGCIAGVLSKLAADKIRMGKTDAFDQYAETCLDTALIGYGLADIYKWINPVEGEATSHLQWFKTQIAKALRYAFNGTTPALNAFGPAIESWLEWAARGGPA